MIFIHSLNYSLQENTDKPQLLLINFIEPTPLVNESSIYFPYQLEEVELEKCVLTKVFLHHPRITHLGLWIEKGKVCETQKT